MSEGNGVIRVGRKGLKKFAFGEEGSPGGDPFEVDVVVAFQAWVCIDEQFRELSEDRMIPDSERARYHQSAVEFVEGLRSEMVGQPGYQPVTTAEALDFLARLREAYDDVAVFFRRRSPEERGSPDTSGVELKFSAEGS